MKRQAGFYTLIAIVFVFLLPQTVSADSSTYIDTSNNGANSQNSVNVQNNTGGVSCINGVCTSNGNSSKTTYCYNGKCTTTDNGSVDYTSPDGNTHIQVNNNTGNNSITVSPQSSAGAAVTPLPTTKPEQTISPNPTITKMRNDINNNVQHQVQTMKEHLKNQNDAISEFFKNEMKNLQNLLNNLFK